MPSLWADRTKRSHVRHAPLSLTAVVATLAVALGGCGGAATTVDDLPADAVFLTAVDRSTDVSTARVEYESTSSRDGAVLHRSAGGATFAPGAISLTFTMGGFRGEGVGSPEISYELRFVDGRMYMRVPELPPGGTEADLADAEWVALEEDGDTDEMAAQMEQFDLGATLQALRDSAEVTEDGRETIAGVEATRYVGTTTLRSLLLAQGTTEEQLEEEAAGDGGPDLDEPMPLTVWIGDDGLVRGYDYTMVDGDVETTQSMTVLEYGLDVDITAPPPEVTVSAEAFESSSQSSAETLEYEELESDDRIVLESEDSATAEPDSAPAPAPEDADDSDG